MNWLGRFETMFTDTLTISRTQRTCRATQQYEGRINATSCCSRPAPNATGSSAAPWRSPGHRRSARHSGTHTKARRLAAHELEKPCQLEQLAARPRSRGHVVRANQCADASASIRATRAKCNMTLRPADRRTSRTRFRRSQSSGARRGPWTKITAARRRHYPGSS